MFVAVEREAVERDELVKLDHPCVHHPFDGGMDEVGPFHHVHHCFLDAPPADEIIPRREPDVGLPHFPDRHDVGVDVHIAW